jgi:uncharacterized protein
MNMIAIAFGVGLAGGLHCVGMCGPLTLAASSLPLRNRWKWVSYRMLYQFGRMFAYGLLGMFIAGLGALFVLGGWQNLLSIILGAAIILFYIIPYSFKTKAPQFWNKGLQMIKNKFSTQLKKNTIGSQLSMGFLNGLLPCGLVYLALATAAMRETIFEGFIVMFAFGAGTLPWLLSVLLLGSMSGFAWRSNIQRYTPYLAGIVAVILILRGFDIHWMHLPMLGQEAEVVICD